METKVLITFVVDQNNIFVYTYINKLYIYVKYIINILINILENKYIIFICIYSLQINFNF